MNVAQGSWSPQGVYLAVDTSTRVGSVCVAVGTAVGARGILDKPAAHGSELVPKIREVLERAGVELAELSGIIVDPVRLIHRCASSGGDGERVVPRSRDPALAVSSLEAGAAS